VLDDDNGVPSSRGGVQEQFTGSAPILHTVIPAAGSSISKQNGQFLREEHPDFEPLYLAPCASDPAFPRVGLSYEMNRLEDFMNAFRVRLPFITRVKSDLSTLRAIPSRAEQEKFSNTGKDRERPSESWKFPPNTDAGKFRIPFSRARSWPSPKLDCAAIRLGPSSDEIEKTSSSPLRSVPMTVRSSPSIDNRTNKSRIAWKPAKNSCSLLPLRGEKVWA
jgi:hypothetical protein